MRGRGAGWEGLNRPKKADKSYLRGRGPYVGRGPRRKMAGIRQRGTKQAGQAPGLRRDRLCAHTLAGQALHPHLAEGGGASSLLVAALDGGQEAFDLTFESIAEKGLSRHGIRFAKKRKSNPAGGWRGRGRAGGHGVVRQAHHDSRVGGGGGWGIGGGGSRAGPASSAFGVELRPGIGLSRGRWAPCGCWGNTVAPLIPSPPALVRPARPGSFSWGAAPPDRRGRGGSSATNPIPALVDEGQHSTVPENLQLLPDLGLYVAVVRVSPAKLGLETTVELLQGELWHSELLH